MTHPATGFRVLPIEEDYTSISNDGDRRTFHVDADFFIGGIWSGIKDIAELAFNELFQLGDIEIIERHSYELFMVLPHQREKINLKYACLTDLSTGEERTRNYPVDRAYRIAHGMINLIQSWKALTNVNQDWHIFVAHFDKSQHLATFCFLEMARRLYKNRIYVTVDGLKEHAFRKHKVYAAPEEIALKPESSCLTNRLEKNVNPSSSMELHSLTSSLSNYDDDWERRYLILLRYYHEAQDTLAIANIAMRSLFYYNHRGYYYEAAVYIESILEHFDDIIEPGDTFRMTLVDHLYQALITTNQAERALQLLDQFALPILEDPHLLVQAYYHRAMLNIRFLANKSMSQAEHNIKSAMHHLQRAEPTISTERYAFLKVFLNNGLALIRVKQNRPADAIQLCGEGFNQLTAQLGEETHKLHRSVLLYNTAQVYASLAQFDHAIEYYLAAIDMDPFYSEYYNELGNLYQKLEQFAQAREQYEKAILFSAPYPEVYFNLAVCETHLQQYQSAIKNFAISESLDPAQPDLFVVRAELYDEIGNKGNAIVDYTNALVLDENNAIAYANRAAIFFECGQLQQAKVDMERAVSLEPENELYAENLEAVVKAIKEAQIERQSAVLKDGSIYQ